jgi:hypothetical protein
MTRRKITRSALTELWDIGASEHDIADHFGCTRHAIRKAVERFDLPRRGPSRRDITREKLVDMIARGLTLAQMGAECHLSHVSMRNRLSDYGLTTQRAARYRESRYAETPDKRNPTPDTATLTGRLIATKGRYAALDELRRAEGWTSTQALQRYHQAARAGA